MPDRWFPDYDVSVAADKARRKRRTRGFSGAWETSSRVCEHPGCEVRAEYRAPYAPDALDRYRWFCLEHIREFNARWNFFSDISEEELDSLLDRARLWDRETWRFGRQPKSAMGAHPHAEGRAWERFGFRDPFEVLGENATQNPREARAGEPRRPRLPETVRRALDALGAEDTETLSEIRRRYRDLVKALHPDMNGGDRSEEERLRVVLWAWEQIKASPAFVERR